MRPQIDDFKKGERLIASKLQKLLEAIQQISRISVSAPLELFWSAAGPHIAIKRTSKDPGNKFGVVHTAINSCSLTPGLVNQYRLDFNADGTVRARVPVLKTDGTPEQFKALDAHGGTIPPGHWVSCAWDNRDIWEVLSAHCTGSCVGGSNNGCQDPPPNCPPGTTPCCQNGVWNCCPESTGCQGMEPGCPEGQHAECINSNWVCVNDSGGGCPEPPPSCPPGFNPLCLPNNTWACVEGCSTPPPVCPPGQTPVCDPLSNSWNCVTP